MATMAYVRLKATMMVPGGRYAAGDLFNDSDPLVKANPGLFGPVEVRSSVEQKTAAPGEKSSVTRTRKKKAD